VTKVQAAGGEVVAPAFDVVDAGRMAILRDPQGALFCVWQAGRTKGAKVVNEHGAVNFNTLHTADLDAAKKFYGEVFGWTTLSLAGAQFWTLPGYGAYLETLRPGIRKEAAEMGAAGFEDVVAVFEPLSDNEQPHWHVTFAVNDADAAATAATKLGGQVVVPPLDAPYVRLTVLADPEGTPFTASQFVAENR
jgi:predicted enzyme related to lactoylglutathione lyase